MWEATPDVVFRLPVAGDAGTLGCLAVGLQINIMIASRLARSGQAGWRSDPGPRKR